MHTHTRTHAYTYTRKGSTHTHVFVWKIIRNTKLWSANIYSLSHTFAQSIAFIHILENGVSVRVCVSVCVSSEERIFLLFRCFHSYSHALYAVYTIEMCLYIRDHQVYTLYIAYSSIYTSMQKKQQREGIALCCTASLFNSVCFLGHFVGREKFTIQCMKFLFTLHSTLHHHHVVVVVVAVASAVAAVATWMPLSFLP